MRSKFFAFLLFFFLLSFFALQAADLTLQYVFQREQEAYEMAKSIEEKIENLNKRLKIVEKVLSERTLFDSPFIEEKYFEEKLPETMNHVNQLKEELASQAREAQKNLPEFIIVPEAK